MPVAARRADRRSTTARIAGRRRPASTRRPATCRLPGLTLPGLRQRALARLPPGAARAHPRPAAARSGPGASGCTPSPPGSTPTRYLALARADYAEMALAGVTCVGRVPLPAPPRPAAAAYADPNAMGEALIEAAARRRHPAHPARHLLPRRRPRRHRPPAAGRRPAPVRRRRRRRAGPTGSRAPARAARRCGSARPSTRCGPSRPTSCARSPLGARAAGPLHVHLSEQPAENEACLAVYGRTPTALLAEHGRARPGHHRRARHPPHRRRRRRCSAAAGTGVCVCPTTERDLADGIGPARRLRRRRVAAVPRQRQHAVIDLLEEARAVELDERLRTGRRGHFAPAELLDGADRRRAPRAGLARRRAARRRAPGPTWSPSGWTAPRTAGVRARPASCIAAVGRRRRTPSSSTAGSWSPTGSTCSGDVGRLLAAAIEPLWEDA